MITTRPSDIIVLFSIRLLPPHEFRLFSVCFRSVALLSSHPKSGIFEQLKTSLLDVPRGFVIYVFVFDQSRVAWNWTPLLIHCRPVKCLFMERSRPRSIACRKRRVRWSFKTVLFGFHGLFFARFLLFFYLFIYTMRFYELLQFMQNSYFELLVTSETC